MSENFKKDDYLNKKSIEADVEMLFGIEVPKKIKEDYEKFNLNEKTDCILGLIVPEKEKKMKEIKEQQIIKEREEK